MIKNIILGLLIICSGTFVFFGSTQRIIAGEQALASEECLMLAKANKAQTKLNKKEAMMSTSHLDKIKIRVEELEKLLIDCKK